MTSFLCLKLQKVVLVAPEGLVVSVEAEREEAFVGFFV